MTCWGPSALCFYLLLWLTGGISTARNMQIGQNVAQRTELCGCVQTEAGVCSSMFSRFCLDMVYGVTVGLAGAYSEKPSQTYGNVVLGETAKANPCQSHQPTLACHTTLCVCVWCICLWLFYPHPSPHWVFCQSYMLFLPTGLWSPSVYTHTHK